MNKKRRGLSVMTTKIENETFVSIDEALAMLVGLDFVPNKQTVESMLAAFEEKAECDLENVKYGPDNDKFLTIYNICRQRRELAASIKEALEAEIEKVTSDSELKLNNEGIHIKISISSLQAWSESNFGITPIAIKSHRTEFIKRKHATKLLEILDMTILEFWESAEPKLPPKNDVIKAYWKKEYEDIIDQGRNSHFSEKVQEVMLKIMRPDKSH